MSTASSTSNGVYINHRLADPNLAAALMQHVDVGVCVVDSKLNIVAINTLARQILDFPADLIRPGLTLEALIRFNATRGDFGDGNVEEMVRERLEVARTVDADSFEYSQPDGSPIQVKRTLLPGGGFITTYAGEPAKNAESLAALHGAQGETEVELEIAEQPRPPAPLTPPAEVENAITTEPQPTAIPGEVDILIADSDAANQQKLSSAFDGTGYSVRIARNGAEALGMYRALSPRALLMNVDLPRISGLEVATAIRNGEAERGGHVPIIALSADIEAKAGAIDAGMDEFLGNPVDAGNLKTTVARLIEGEPEKLDEPVPAAAAVEKVEKATADTPTTEWQHTIRVLLAEDNEANHEVFLELMEDGPYEVTGVWNGRDAVIQYIAKPSAFDVILMDMSMPVMTGIEATEAIRAHEKVKNLAAIPIIGISAAPTSEMRHKAETAGVNEYLVKPVNVEKLLTSISGQSIECNVQDLKNTGKRMTNAVTPDETGQVRSIADLARKYGRA